MESPISLDCLEAYSALVTIESSESHPHRPYVNHNALRHMSELHLRDTFHMTLCLVGGHAYCGPPPINTGPVFG